MIDLKVGDEVRLMWVNAYHHGATLVVDKVNKKSFKATEKERSYRPGTKWNVHKLSKFGILRYDEYGTHIRTDWYDNGEYDFSGDPIAKKGIW